MRFSWPNIAFITKKKSGRIGVEKSGSVALGFGFAACESKHSSMLSFCPHQKINIENVITTLNLLFN
jgi:hypothetical protein